MAKIFSANWVFETQDGREFIVPNVVTVEMPLYKYQLDESQINIVLRGKLVSFRKNLKKDPLTKLEKIKQIDYIKQVGITSY